MSEYHDFEVPTQLKEQYDIKRIAKEADTILIELDHKAIRFDIEPKWKNTVANFEKQSKIFGITNQELKQALMLYLSEQYLKLLVNSNGNGNGNANANANGEDDDVSIAHKALDIAQEQCSELFLDQFGTAYAAVQIDEHIETLPLKSSRFRNWLCGQYYSTHDEVLGGYTVTHVLNILKAEAEFGGGVTRNLYLRVASVPERPFTIYYDLTNKNWQLVKITPQGWSIEYAPIMFTRHKAQQPQVYPSLEYPPDIFDQFMDLINIKGKDDRLVVKGYIISLFYPDIPKPISVIIAEQGSAKTTEHELQKKLVDPSGKETLTFPRDITEMVQKLSHNYVAYFDNVSGIKYWQSDQLCRAVTGSGYSKRELYTDDEDIIYNFMRCVGINGINITGLNADLLDRSIIRKRESIPREKRRLKKDIQAEFERIRPQLLAYIFDILVKVLEVKSNGGIKLNGLPRMADFAEIAEIACRCMGYDDDEFLKAYDKNIGLQIDEAIAANLLSNAIIKFMEYQNEWSGSATELHRRLEEVATTDLKINTNSTKQWPKAANVLAGKLNEVKTNLREIGIIIDTEAAKNPTTRVKTIYLCKQSFGSLESFDTNDSKNVPYTIDNNNLSNGPNDANDTLHTSLDDDLEKYAIRLGNYGTWKCKHCEYKDDMVGMITHLKRDHIMEGDPT